MKQTLYTTPFLMLPDFHLEFRIDTNACGHGMGVVLQQKRQPIFFFSKALGVRHQALSIYEKEMLVVLLVVKKWHLYLVGRHFRIRNDHQSLWFISD